MKRATKGEKEKAITNRNTHCRCAIYRRHRCECLFYHLAIQRGPKEFLQNNADLEVADETMDTF